MVHVEQLCEHSEQQDSRLLISHSNMQSFLCAVMNILLDLWSGHGCIMHQAYWLLLVMIWRLSVCVRACVCVHMFYLDVIRNL